MFEKTGIFIDPETDAPAQGSVFDYCQTQRDWHIDPVSKQIIDISDLPNGDFIKNPRLGVTNVDLDSQGSLTGIIAATNGAVAGNKQPIIPAVGNSFSHTGGGGKTSIDTYPLLHKIIENNLRSQFGRPLQKI